MKAEIYIELPASPAQEIRLAVRRGDRLEAVHPGSYQPAGRPKAIAFAPALSAARLRVPVAAKSEAEARKAALYAAEDDIGQPVEDVHMVLGPKQPASAERDLYITDRALLQHWTETLQSLGLGHAEIVAEASLDLEPGRVLDFGDRLLIQTRDGLVGADTAWPEEIIAGLLRQADQEGAVRTPADALETLAALDARLPGVRLTETRGNGNGGAAKGLGRWRLAGALTLAAAGIWIAGLHLEINSLLTNARQQDAEARALYRAQFSGAPEPVDIHAEVRRLSALTSGTHGQFLNLSAALYDGLAARPATRLLRLSYAEADAALSATLRFDTAASAEDFRAALEASGWNARTESLADTPPAVEATLTLRANP